MDIILQDLDPRETYLKWFSNNGKIRPNGRNMFEIPKISLKPGIIPNFDVFLYFLGVISSSEGSAMINYGETIVIASLKSEVAEPDVSAPGKGFLGI